ncbi:hypothetical protein BJ912DRAFT_1074825 [Pholiota molesta]|nr:hypothetical protein BJ912DRAFT_1074825 [Pholiota molesta]
MQVSGTSHAYEAFKDQPLLPFCNDSPTACQSTLKLSSALSQERHSQGNETSEEKEERSAVANSDRRARFPPPYAGSAAPWINRRLEKPRDQNAAREGARRVPGTPPFRSHGSLVEAGRSARGFLLGCVPRPARKSSSGRSAPRAFTRAKMTAEEPEKLYQYLLKFYLPTVPHFRCAIMRRTHSPGAARAVLVPIVLVARAPASCVNINFTSPPGSDLNDWALVPEKSALHGLHAV